MLNNEMNHSEFRKPEGQSPASDTLIGRFRPPVIEGPIEFPHNDNPKGGEGEHSRFDPPVLGEPIVFYPSGPEKNTFPHPNPPLDGGWKDFIPRVGGQWDDQPGESVWKPDPESVPANPLTNPDQLTWGEILDKYGIDGIPFHDGFPDFSEVSKGDVAIDDFTDSRESNFAQADEKLAEQKGCTPEEVRQWRKENGYTWHECEDGRTMQKVPREVHGNIPHSGGISNYKAQHASD